jgi:hypothetical protein
MGNLSQYAEQIQGVQSKLNEAESIKDNMDEMISKRFEEVSNKMMKSLEGLVNANNKDTIMSSSVTQAVLSIAQNNQLLMRDLEKEMRQTNKDMTANNNALKAEVKKVGDGVSKTLAGQLTNIASQVKAIPTQFPEQIKTDLSGVEKGIRNLMSAISSIPLPDIPKQADMTPQFKRLEKQLIALKKKPNHEFIVHRNSDDLVTKVTVI